MSLARVTLCHVSTVPRVVSGTGDTLAEMVGSNNNKM